MRAGLRSARVSPLVAVHGGAAGAAFVVTWASGGAALAWLDDGVPVDGALAPGAAAYYALPMPASPRPPGDVFITMSAAAGAPAGYLARWAAPPLNAGFRVTPARKANSTKGS